jgi:two-component system, cell cycle sensor histidine kinase and response regulator CckA
VAEGMKRSIEDIKRRLRLIVGIIVVAVICISGIAILSERRDTLTAAERLATGYSRALAEHSESAFSEADGVLRELLGELRRSGGLERMDQAELFHQIRMRMLNCPQVGTLFMVDRKGMMRINSDEFPSKQIDVSDRDYFRTYLKTPGLDLSIGKPLMSRLVQRWRFNLMRPLNRPGDPFAGLMAVGFETQYFNRFFNPQNLGLRGVVLLLRDDGVPLVHEPHRKGAENFDFKQSLLFREKLPRSPSGVYHVNNALTEHQSLVVAYQRLSRFPVIAVVGLNEQDVLAPWQGRAVRQGCLTLALCLLVLILNKILFSHLDRLKAAQSTVMDQQAQLTIKAAQIDAALDVILQVDEEGLLVHFNQALCRLTGYSQTELTGKRLQDLKPPEYAAQVQAHIARMKLTGAATFESAYLTRDGSEIPVEVHAQVMQSDGRTLVLSIARDITQRKRAESRERNRLKTLERIASDAPLQELLECIVAFVEKESPGALCSVLLVDEGGTRLRHGAAPSLPQFYNEAVDGLAIGKGMGSCGTAAFLRRRVVVEDIDPHPYWKNFQPARDAGLRSCWSEPVISSSGALLGTLAIYHREPQLPSEEEILLIESAAHLASIAIGRVRSDESRRALEEQLRHSQKIEAVGQLAAGVAHDFNNLLTPIMVYADMLRRGFAADDPRLNMAETMSKAGQKASELTQKLLSFSRKQMLKKTPLDLNEVITCFRDIMRTTLRENISIDLKLSRRATLVNADRGQLEQVLLNLLLNARDAISGQGAITVQTGHLVLDDDYLRQHPGTKPGRYVLLAFTDDGCGMSEETLRRMYEPFFTTKEVGRGTGLGLATVYGIVKHHEGCIEVKSRPGEGARFEIYLPALQRGEAEPVGFAAAEAEQQDGGGRTILLVEDNVMIREMVQDLLVSFGFRVLSAASPAEARELAEREPAIDLLVTDVIMPQMSGPQLYEQLQRLHTRLPVLYMSGYTSSLIPDGADDFLAKPFTLEQLMEKVERVLAGAQAGHSQEETGGAA